MARLSPAEKIERIKRVIKAWETYRPGESFYGLTLAKFKEDVKDSFDSRARIADFLHGLRIAIVARNHADKRSERIIRGVKFSVLAHPLEGENGEMYGAMGYVRSIARRRRRKAKKKGKG